MGEIRIFRKKLVSLEEASFIETEPIFIEYERPLKKKQEKITSFFF